MNSMSKPVVLTALQTLQLSLSGVKLIEASAGTGKTYAISNLYLRYVLQGVRVNQILVVTFTNAATEELRGRIRERLHDTLLVIQQWRCGELEKLPKDEFLNALLSDMQSQPAQYSEQSVARLRLAIRTMDEASIYTINGFCQRALTDHAFSSGQAFELELVNDDDALWQEALKDWWRSTAYELDSVQIRLLTDALGSLPKFLESQKPLRAARDRRVVPDRGDDMASIHGLWRGLETPLRELAREWLNRADELKEILLQSKALSRAKGCGYGVAELMSSLARLDNYFNSDALLEVPAELVLLAADNLRSNNKPSKIDTDPQLQDRFFLQCQAIVDDATALRERFTIAALLSATREGRTRMESAKILTRTISFSDQLTRLHDALHAPSGEALTEALRRAFPVAMIDEFQDTDTIQYRIFRHLYLNASPVAEEPGALIMIGDPKQAIYSFRGGDIFAYAEAKRDVGDNLYTLDTNWRSVPELVNAFNVFFTRRRVAFVYEEAIDYLPVHSAVKEHKPLLENGRAVSPLTLWQIPAGDDGKPRNKREAEQLIAASVTDEMARLINAGMSGDVTLGNMPLRPGDIAVLVRTNFEGAAMREALLTRGLNAVTVGRDKVFQSDEARALELLLSAVVHCNDRTLLRAALSSDLLALDYVLMATIIDDQAHWLQWAECMKSLHMLWQQKGFMAMFQSLLQNSLFSMPVELQEGLQIGLQIAMQPLAERRLTNLLHLSELLQQVSRTHPGLESLLNWFREQIAETSDVETELRLESDDALIKIVTIHASKGLQYPVVFVPFLWSCRPIEKKRSGIAFHDATGEAFLDLGSAAIDKNLFLAERERLAEDVRLAYVALTRAQAKVYLLWGEAGDARFRTSSRTALAWLLHSQQNAADLNSEFPNADLDEPQFSQRLHALAEASAGSIEVRPLPMTAIVTLQTMESETLVLQPAQFTGGIATDWRISSFSSLTRDIHQAPHSGSTAATTDPIIGFAAGSHVGLFLHKMLEDLDFQGDISAQAVTLNQKYAQYYGFDPDRQQDVVVAWIHNILHTPLNTDGFTLAQLPRSRRLDELEFDFAIDKVNVPTLNQVIARWAGITLNPINVEDFRGMITGVIDLVFEHDGRFYIADYKSNFLGSALTDYAPEQLRQGIFDRRYDLQYLLYVLALHRYLRQRIRDYDYVRHMGGIYYLFLRGMRPASGPRFGVHFDLPPLALIHELDTQVLGHQGMARADRGEHV
ncbi:MAG: exodeoxyribonuclease V subunit beta [Gammaproteobacteria bacterium]|nr:exodeoxyribonuclease V subunit beta [Gammaproteobacteria bacterium]MDP2140504.1 exodeoxyribonuclease V subunit beta [Gammaproteobacteria bacterium]MDP2348813.1 exodeoxyribonuclease V subunit beta [Gammaproteobacteria bacterium]